MYGDKKCKKCGTSIPMLIKRDLTRKNFCSRSCSNSFNSALRLSHLTEKTCECCGTLYIPKQVTQIFCSPKCSAKLQVERSYKYLNNNKEAYIKHLLYKKDRKDIPLEYILELYDNQLGKCALSGVSLTFIKKVNSDKVHTNLSIDRIDSSKGYEIGNIQLVCAIVNIMKSTLSVSELQWWCKRIVEGG